MLTIKIFRTSEAVRVLCIDDTDKQAEFQRILEIIALPHVLDRQQYTGDLIESLIETTGKIVDKA